MGEVSPIQTYKLQVELYNHPDPNTVAYVFRGLKESFYLGFEPSMHNLEICSHPPFMHPAVIDKYLQNEVGIGRVGGPFSTPPKSNLHISSFGVIPKRNQTGQCRLILDFSSRTGNSVNDAVPKDKFSVQYMKVDDIIDTIMRLDRGTLVAKFDGS